MSLVDHPLRQQVVGEMQLRRFPVFTVPARLIQIVRQVEDRAAEAEMLARLWPDIDITARHAEMSVSDDIRLTWERHSEASTLTLIATAGSDLSPQWECAELCDLLEQIEAVPGAVVRASHLIILADGPDAAQAIATAGFAEAQLVSCFIRSPSGARVRLWTDFRIHADGYGRMVVVAPEMPLPDLSRCVQQLQELGNYRNLALLGLPEARDAWQQLDRLEAELDLVGHALAQGQERDDAMLATLASISAQLLSIDSRCGYRMSATAAYARIVQNRLALLNVEPIAGYQSLADFTERRFIPAIHTCATLSDRLALLNGRAAQFTALLRARIETHIENQNGQLLASMDKSARMQLRLQHLVEGLTSVAISYYLVALIAYPLKAAEKHWPAFSATLTLGLLAPAVVLVLVTAMNRARKQLVSDDKPPLSGP